MRRKPDTLIPIERSILEAAAQLHRQGIEEFYGFQIAKEIGDQKGARLLTGYGTLYRALGRLQQLGILSSRWEEPLPAEQNRPRRRYYRLTGEGVPALSNPLPSNAPVDYVWRVSPS
jgi:PadR family transcriptional regulator PadR